MGSKEYGTRFVHIRLDGDRGPLGMAAVTLAVRRLAPGVFAVGGAFCAPQEPSFSKAKGRAIAEGRLTCLLEQVAPVDVAKDGGLEALKMCAEVQPGVLVYEGADPTKERPALRDVLTTLRTRPYKDYEGRGGPWWWLGFLQEVAAGRVLRKRSAA